MLFTFFFCLPLSQEGANVTHLTVQMSKLGSCSRNMLYTASTRKNSQYGLLVVPIPNVLVERPEL